MTDISASRALRLCAIFFLVSLKVLADEGMWIPMLLGKYNEADMQMKGLKLSADDIYSVNHASLKDAVVQFGGGCTGELISGEGLLLTNHHCGYSRVQSHSTLEHDYTADGYWAMNRSEELSNPGLTVTFLIRMEDVTQAVIKDVTADMTEAKRKSVIDKAAREAAKKSIEGTHYDASIREFFNGNEYYLFVTETFRDVRLVGAPPSSIGKFGGDTDNWMWPRHTGDFSLFRIYADSLNRPAEYSPYNVPYKPKKYFEVSLKPLQEGDFTMVFGFPGRTQEYLTSYAVQQLVEEEDPLKISIREKRLNIMEQAMDVDPQVKLDLSSKYNSISNYYKKFMGESRGLKRLDAIAKKQEREKQLSDWVNSTSAKSQYSTLLPELQKTYNDFSNYNKAVTLLNEAFNGLDFVKHIDNFYKFNEDAVKGMKKEEAEKEVDKLSKKSASFFDNYKREIDRDIADQLVPLFLKELYGNDSCKVLDGKYKCDFQQYLDAVFNTGILMNRQKADDFIGQLKAQVAKTKQGEIVNFSKLSGKLKTDPGFHFVETTMNYYRSDVAANYYKLDAKLDSLNRIYVKAIKEMNSGKLFYPDANSTLRITYGKVNGYSPADGVQNTPFTTIDGIIEKENPNDKEFIVPEKLKELYLKKDYGQYAVNGTVPVCFLASNHTTGGNSGSPVLNAYGQLIGINFDRNWEGTAADVMYDPTQARNISIDIRYTLFIIDKFAGATHLLDEMTIVK